jgi:hypothetical protein
MQIGDITPILSLVLTVVSALLTQLWRMRKKIGVAKTNPLHFALKEVVDSLTYQDDSLYLMSLLSKLVKNLLQYIQLLAANGEEVLIEEIKAMTQSLAVDIARLQARVDPESLSNDKKLVLDEITRLLSKGG